jgi:uncharacterized membrane protein YfcA
MAEFMLLFAIGVVAQLVDGALGMAYGVLTNTALLAIGLPPAQASALVHTAEVFTTGASAASHLYHRNVDWRLVVRLGLTGVLGAVVGAWVLSNIDVSAARRFVYAYLLLVGIYILLRSARPSPPRRTPPGWWTPPVGFLAGFLDASGGGGWGPMTTSTLIGAGHAPRQTVGSVNTTELFVTAAAATMFFVELGASSLEQLAPIVLGGMLAAPFGGWAVKAMPARMLMVAVGALLVVISTVQLVRAFKLA